MICPHEHDVKATFLGQSERGACFTLRDLAGPNCTDGAAKNLFGLLVRAGWLTIHNQEHYLADITEHEWLLMLELAAIEEEV